LDFAGDDGEEELVFPIFWIDPKAPKILSILSPGHFLPKDSFHL
jgi:hypothetical protein